MPGVLYRPVPKQVVDFSGLTTNGNSVTVLGAKGLDSSQGRDVVLIARLHDVTWPTGATVTISLRQDAPTAEDPADFTPSTDLVSVTFTEGTDTAPAVKVTTTSSHAAFLRVYIKGTIGASTGTFQPTISVDVNVRS